MLLALSGIGSEFFMQKDPLKSYPFFARSYPSATRTEVAEATALAEEHVTEMDLVEDEDSSSSNDDEKYISIVPPFSHSNGIHNTQNRD